MSKTRRHNGTNKEISAVTYLNVKAPRVRTTLMEVRNLLNRVDTNRLT